MDWEVLLSPSGWTLLHGISEEEVTTLQPDLPSDLVTNVGDALRQLVRGRLLRLWSELLLSLCVMRQQRLAVLVHRRAGRRTVTKSLAA